ncbi:MAG TPA: hypothetical protein VFT06_09520 [Flavisolibacter sp.]|nr:hypothetical protein [Flavisolibacter sp.]
MTSTNAVRVVAPSLNGSRIMKNGRKFFLMLFALFCLSSFSFAQVQCALSSTIIPSSIVLPMGGMGGSFVIDITGGTGPYKYTVYDMHMNLIQPEATALTEPFVVKDLAAGYYWVDIVDANGCKTFVDGDLQTHPCTFVANYSNVVNASYGQANGSFQVNIVDGVAPFEVTVYDMHMNLITPLLVFNTAPFTISGLPSNYYWVGIRDARGCYGFVDVDVQCYKNCEPVKICTYTQGYYGVPGGNNSHLNLLNSILAGGPITVGSNGRTVKAVTAQQVIDFLPGGGPSKVLALGNGTLGTAPYTGTSNNTLLSQTLTLALNLGIPGTTLGSIPLTGLVSNSVINAVTASGNTATVAGLLAFANSALGGGSLYGVTLSNINDAVTAINEYFDECRLYTGAPMVILASPRTTEMNQDKAEVASDIMVAASPNPFQSNIRFVIQSKVSGNAELGLYNMAGAKVAVPFSGYISAGRSQTVDYTVPSTMRGGLLYMMKVGDKMTSGKLISASH